MIKSCFSLFFMFVCFFTSCREFDSFRLEDNPDLPRLIRDWGSHYRPVPSTPIELYHFPYSDDCVVLMRIGNREYSRVFGYNDEWHYWADFGVPHEEYDLDGYPDEIIAFSEGIILPQPEGVDGDGYESEEYDEE